MTYFIDGVLIIAGLDSEGRVISLSFPYVTNEAGQPLVLTFTPGIAVDNINSWLKQVISLLGL